MEAHRLSQFQRNVVAAVVLLFGLFIGRSFRGNDLKVPTLELDSEDAVNTILDGKLMLHIGGQHRAGTTLVWNLLRRLPSISGFDPDDACRRRKYFGCTPQIPCSCMEYEGLFLQSVLPRWNLDGFGIGRYALWPETHLTETSEQVASTEGRAFLRSTLLNEWGILWDLSRPVLLEKSPSNARTLRFLGAIWGPTHTRILVITRHPMAVALALERFTTTHRSSARSIHVSKENNSTPEITTRTDEREGGEGDSKLSLYLRVLHWLVIEEAVTMDRLELSAPLTRRVRFYDIGK